MVSKLNKQQLEAINTLSGNLLILASAGTGKTTTIVERYVNLVENYNYNPNEILMTTFTNKAAKDLIDKIAKRTKKTPLWVGTMHSLFLRILRENSSKFFEKEFNLLTDDSDKKRIIKQILKEEKIDNNKDNLAYFLNRINKFKNAGVLAENLKENINLDEQKGVTEEIVDDQVIKVDSSVKNKSIRIYKKYQQFLKINNLVDFDDILLLTFKLLDENKDLRETYSNKFKAIMVDEAQDLNVVQMKILELLKRDNLCLIGDDCQNIYEWRGSSNKLVFEFDKTAKKIILKENYRSTNKIISAVNKVIDSFKFKIEKDLVCTRKSGEDIKFELFQDFDDETDFIVQEVKQLLKNKEKKEDIAVLFRTNNIGKKLEKEFRRNKIPCHLSRSKSFFEREEVKDILSFLRLKTDSYSFYDFDRVIKLLPGFGKSKIDKFKELSNRYKLPLLKSLNYSNELKLNDEAKHYLLLLKESLSSKENPIKLFLKNFNYLERIANKYKEDPEKIDDKKENIELLKELYQEFSTEPKGIIKFLDSLMDLEKKEKDKDKIILTTIHSAKGLEWKYVFLCACNEKILPYYIKDLDVSKRDSELRLFYVAISRAKDFLTVTSSDHHEWKELEPSSFIDIIN